MGGVCQLLTKMICYSSICLLVFGGSSFVELNLCFKALRIIHFFYLIINLALQRMQSQIYSDLQTYFGTIKHPITETHLLYLKSHPEIQTMLNDFLSSCLILQPDNVYEHARTFFTREKPKIIHNPLIISGCSGSGKGTLINHLLKNYPETFELSVSYTTRGPRKGEKHGREYYFVEKGDFEEEIKKSIFAQFNEVHGNYYGTHKGRLREIMAKGKICLLDIDLQGGTQIHDQFPSFNFLFIDVPSLEEVEKRLRGRGTESEEAIGRRMRNAEKELQKVKELDYYKHLLNDELQESKKGMVRYIKQLYGVEI